MSKPAANGLFKDQGVLALLESCKPIWAVGYAQGLIGWDTETYMPEDGAEDRGVASGQLSLKTQEMQLALKPQLDGLQGAQGLNAYDAAVVRVLNRDLVFYTKIPPEMIEEMSRLTEESAIVWRRARKSSNFPEFEPNLKRIVELSRQMAEKLGYTDHPYSALADQYEEGVTATDLDKMFAVLAPRIKAMVRRIVDDGIFSAAQPLEKATYTTDQLKPINEWLIKSLGIPPSRFRMDVSTHPFTQGLSRNDVRLTTRYEGINFRNTIYSTVHESGHAMYELDIDPRLSYTPLGDGVSFGVHEAQSRTWENIIGRSRSFVHFMYPKIRELPSAAQNGEEDIYRYVNAVSPSAIRVEADEVTYTMHIILRYEIEKALIAGSLQVHELPQFWNDKMEEYLGIRPKNDAEGVLQDVHWSDGLFGYFPAYAIGNIIGAMEMEKMEQDLGHGIWDDIAAGKFSNVQEWFRQNIHLHGSTYTPRELQLRALGRAYDPEPFVRYLDRKYLRQ